MGMIARLTIFHLLILTACGCAFAQQVSFNATISQPAGSVLLPSASPDLAESADSLNQPLYSAEDVLLYLPAPANLAESYSENGETAEVIILGPRLSKNNRYDIIPVGLMEFDEGNRTVIRVLAIPANPSLQTIKSPSLGQLQANYPGVIDILSIWFENAYGDRQSEYIGVKDEQEALRFLRRRE